MKRHHLLLALGLLIGEGCSVESARTMDVESVKSAPEGVPDGTPAFRAMPARVISAAGLPEAQPDAPTDGAAAAPVPSVPRKIVYTADVELIVEEFTQAERALVRLVKENGGYLAEMNIRGATGSHRFGTWKARVAVEKFDAFLEAVAQLGELQRRSSNSQDVTEEYYDLDARIKNKKVEEARLLKHLQESTGKLAEILQVEKELTRVREEIERQQGRLQLLANLSSLTTVTITIHERENYIPPQSPTFATTISRTFSNSVDTLVGFGKNLLLAVVAVAPWLPVLALVALALWPLSRRFRPRSLRPRAGPIGPAA